MEINKFQIPIPDVPVKVHRDILNPKLFPADLIPRTSCKNIVIKNSQKDPQKSKKIPLKVTFSLVSSFENFFHDAFAASSRDQICGKFFGQFI